MERPYVKLDIQYEMQINDRMVLWQYGVLYYWMKYIFEEGNVAEDES